MYENYEQEDYLMKGKSGKSGSVQHRTADGIGFCAG